MEGTLPHKTFSNFSGCNVPYLCCTKDKANWPYKTVRLHAYVGFVKLQKSYFNDFWVWVLKIIILSKDFKPLCFQVNFVFFLYALFHLSQSFEIYLSQIGLFVSFFCFSHICHTHLHQYFLKRLRELKSRLLLLQQLFYFM